MKRFVENSSVLEYEDASQTEPFDWAGYWKEHPIEAQLRVKLDKAREGLALYANRINWTRYDSGEVDFTEFNYDDSSQPWLVAQRYLAEIEEKP